MQCADCNRYASGNCLSCLQRSAYSIQKYTGDTPPYASIIIEGGTKHDSGKPDLSILPPAGLEGAAKVFEFGANKYGRYNFMGGFKYSRLIAAALRHITAWTWTQDNDEESGYSHLDHAICCLLMLRQIIHIGSGQDDRYIASGSKSIDNATSQS